MRKHIVALSLTVLAVLACGSVHDEPEPER